VLAFWVGIVDDAVMARDFARVDRDQLFLMPPDMRSWLPADHEVWFVIDVVDRLDLSVLEGTYRLGGRGACPTSPRMLLTLLVWGYSRGVVSSRKIEAACREDVSFRVICGNQVPDHTTIARLRQRHEQVAKDLFVQVLGLCAEAGLVSLGLLAVDGTKMSANAALDANRDVGRLRERVQAMFDEAAALDAEEDVEFGDGNGRGLPAELVDPDARAARISELLAGLDAEGSGRQRVNLTDDDSRIMQTASGGKVQGYNAQAVCVEGHVVVAAAVTSEVNDVHQLHPMLDLVDVNVAAAGVKGQVGTTLADTGYFTAANMADAREKGRDVLAATTKRHLQPVDGSDRDIEAETEAQAAFDADQARIAAEINDIRTAWAIVFAQLADGEITMADAQAQLHMGKSTVGRHLKEWRDGGADAFTVTQPKWRVPRPATRTDAQLARDAMNDRFAVETNRELYKKRSHMIETLFARNKSIRGITRFARRGIEAVGAEWQLITMVHNIGQLRTVS